MRRNGLQKSPGGFTLIEMLGFLILLGAVMLLSGSVLATCLKGINQANKHMTQARILDVAIVQLRQDVWASVQMQQPDAQTLRLAHPDGASVVWTVTPTHDLKRAATARPGAAPELRTFSGLPEDLTLTASAPVVVLSSKDSSGRAASIQIPSQFLVAGGKP